MRVFNSQEERERRVEERLSGILMASNTGEEGKGGKMSSM